jgi:hypothetical protein
LHQFHQFSSPRVVSGSSETFRDVPWSMCIGAIGSNRWTVGQQDRLESERVYCLVDRDFYSSSENVRRQQAINVWVWNNQTQTFSGGSFGGYLLGNANDLNETRFTEGTYWKRISWNPFLQNGGGAVMFPSLTIDHPGGSYGDGSVVVTAAAIRYAAGFDNRGTGVLYRISNGYWNATDFEFNDVRSSVYPSQCWVDLDGKFLYVNISGSAGQFDEFGQPRNSRQINRDEIGLFAYAPIAWDGIGDATPENHNRYRVHVSGQPGISSMTLPYVYQEKLILGPGCY